MKLLNLNAYTYETTFTFTEPQFVTLSNNGSDPITYNFDAGVTASGNITLQPGQSSDDFRTCTTLHLLSSKGIQPIQAELEREISDQFGTLSKKTGNFAYNTDIGLRKWRAALAQIKAGKSMLAHLNVLGDSISEGALAGAGGGAGAASLWQTNGYLGRVRSALNTKFGDAGLGYIPTYYPYGAPLWTFSAGWYDNSNFFGTTGLSKTTGTAGSTASITFSGTGIGIVFAKGSGAGTFQWNIGGGANTQVDTYNATNVNATTYEIGGLADGTHTLNITANLANGRNFFLLGAYPIKSISSGIRVNMCGRYGTRVGDHTSDKSLSCAIDMWTPKLCIIALGANDFTGGTDLTSFTNSYQTIISRALQFGDVMLLSTGLRTDGPSPIGVQQSAYVNAMYTLAVQNNIAFLDIFNRWSGDPNFANSQLNFLGDAVHPNDYGHQDIATAILNVLLEPSA